MVDFRIDSGAKINVLPIPLWDEVKIVDRDDHWRIRHLRESVYMLGYSTYWVDQV